MENTPAHKFYPGEFVRFGYMLGIVKEEYAPNRYEVALSDGGAMEIGGAICTSGDLLSPRSPDSQEICSIHHRVKEFEEWGRLAKTWRCPLCEIYRVDVIRAEMVKQAKWILRCIPRDPEDDAHRTRAFNPLGECPICHEKFASCGCYENL